ncbi:MAG: hypothetical protein LBT06_17120 [Hungatella sp.]|nr:hypothetical protein [Hungatella sp.]
MEFTKQMLNEERYKLIFDFKSRLKSPVLAILEEGNTREKLNILNFGADDYLERKNLEKDCCLKIKQLLSKKKDHGVDERKK